MSAGTGASSAETSDELLDQLRTTMGKMELALGAIGESIVWTDDTGRIQWCNGIFERLVGRHRIAIVGTALPELLPLEQEGHPIARAVHPVNRAQIEGRPLTDTYEWRAADRRTNFEIAASRFQIGANAPSVVLVIHDVTERRHAEEQIRRSEERYRSVVSAMSEGIVLQDATGVIEACNASAETILGLTQDQMLGLTSVDPRWRAIHEDGSPFPGETHPAMVTLRTGEPLSNVIMGVHKPDGTLTWISINSQPLVRPGEAKPHAVVTSFADITERRQTEAALERVNRVQRTLSVANQALVRADEEIPLLEAICRAAVEEGGFWFAWVGYREDDEAGTLRPMAHAGHEDGYLTNIQVSWHDVPTGRGPTGTAVREAHTVVMRRIASDPAMAPWRSEELKRDYASSAAFPLRTSDGVRGALTIYSAEPDAFGTEEVSLFEELAADLSYGVEALRTRVTAAAAEAERRRLATAIEQSADSVVITDTAGTIEYVNPAFERVTGYTSAEAVGANPRILKSGHQAPAFYQAMWAALTAGQSWVAEFVNRRKDGSLFEEEAVISPVRDEGGRTTGYVAVKRDVTHERALEQRSTEFVRERALIADTIRSIRAGDTPEATAHAVCRQVLSLTGVVAAQIFIFELDGRAMPIAFVVAGQPDPPLRRLPHQRSRHLHERAAEGPWIEPWVDRPWHPYNRLLTGFGAHAVAYAPIRHEQRLIGLLVIDGAPSAGEAALSEALPAVVEFADLAGVLIGRDIAERTEVTRGRDRITALIKRQAFHPVFQPIVDLGRATAVGYEALTRFDDGVAPDVRFAEAAAVGLGPELEIATLRAALVGAERMPDRARLNLNVSPELILAREPLRTLIRPCRQPLVLEVTEHAEIADYPSFRAALADLGPNVTLAVDDAGAGFASLRHILELHPAFVKLDRSLVADLESDEARQALIVGLVHFARSTGCRLIAEGIETVDELATLRALKIPLGQGYLLGRPAPLTS